MDLTLLQRRIAGREKATVLLQLLDAAERDDVEFMRALVEAMQRELPVDSSEPAKPPRSLSSLGSEQLRFGAYNGITFDNVPLSYLRRIVGMQEDTVKLLQEYLRHPDLRTRRGHEADF